MYCSSKDEIGTSGWRMRERDFTCVRLTVADFETHMIERIKFR